MIKAVVFLLTGRRCRSRGDVKRPSTTTSRPRDEHSQARPSYSRQGRSGAADLSPRTAIGSLWWARRPSARRVLSRAYCTSALWPSTRLPLKSFTAATTSWTDDHWPSTSSTPPVSHRTHSITRWQQTLTSDVMPATWKGHALNGARRICYGNYSCLSVRLLHSRILYGKMAEHGISCSQLSGHVAPSSIGHYKNRIHGN